MPNQLLNGYAITHHLNMIRYGNIKNINRVERNIYLSNAQNRLYTGG